MIKSTNNVTTIGNEILNAADTVAPPLLYSHPPPKDTPLNLIISCPWETTTPPINLNFRRIQVVKY